MQLNKNKDISIAVLPFMTMSEDTAHEYFSDGLTEEIINALTKIQGLKVTSRTSSFYYKNKNIPIKTIGKELNATLVLEGSVRVSGKKMRITAQLINAGEDFHLFSETWDRVPEDIFEVQDEISLIIAERSREHLGHFEIQDHLVDKQTKNFQAYTWFLKGRYYFRTWSSDQMQKAIECYDKALNLDPDHAESMIGKADVLGFMATTGFMDHQEAWSKAERLIRRALEIHPDMAEAHYQLSNLHFFVHSDFRSSLEAALKAKELKPNHPETNQHLSFLYLLAGEKNKARHYLDHCLRVDPKSQETRFFEAYFYYMSQYYDKALKLLDKILKENSMNIPAQSVYCYCLLLAGKFDKALRFFDDFAEGTIVYEDKLGIQTLAYILKKNKKKSENLIGELEERAKTPQGFRADSFLLFIYALRKEYDKAYAWIEKALANRSSLLLIHLNDPLVGELRKEDQYLSIMKRVYTLVKETTAAKAKAIMNDEQAKQFVHKLSAYMKEESPYLNMDISLRSLAAEIDMHPNKLSWLLNQHFNKNFNQFINSYRIDHFKKLALDPSNKRLNIMGIAYESGFNSKTVFNTYFKNETGISPREWISSTSGS